MDTLSAFAMGQANRDKPMRVFDWDKAARIIVERKAKDAEAGLAGDLEWTQGQILKDGKPVLESYTFLSSCWATPLLIVEGQEIDCWIYEKDKPEWGAYTVWPESAVAILRGAK